MLGNSVQMWVIFGASIGVALVLDLDVFHRKTHAISFKEALIESASWIGLALLFNLWLYISLGQQAGVEFLTGYLVEKSLSVDNIFIFLLVFRSYDVAPRLRHKILYFGVLGALILRALFVFAGVELLRHFHFILYLFGAVLIWAALQMFTPSARIVRPQHNWLVRLAMRVVPVETECYGDAFYVKRGMNWYATPLFLALLAVEALDIVFAVDSVPAVLAITRNTFIVYSSNAFAILGLRALYFAFANILADVRFLHQGLAAILLFVGGKMLVSELVPVSASASLSIIAGIMAATVTASLLFPRGKLA